MSDAPKNEVSAESGGHAEPTVAEQAVLTVTADGTVSPPPEGAVEASSVAAPAPEMALAEADSVPAAAAAASATGKTMSDTPHNHNTPAVAPVVIKQSGGKGIALGALVLSMLALGAGGFLFVQGQNVLKTQELALAQKIDAAGLGQSQQAALISAHEQSLKQLLAQVKDMQAVQQQQGVQLEGSRRAYQELVKSRADWLVDETEASLNLAAQQLLISGNVPAAVRVLENLESRLARFDQPQLLPVKQAISQDLAALKNQPHVDATAALLRLSRLESAVASLPLAADAVLQPGAEPAAAVADTAAPWWRRAWQNTLNSLKGMVEVRRLDNNDSMLMAPEQVFFVRENLRLRILDARLALMQRSGEVYGHDLNSAEAAVKQYFDTHAATTQAWLKELADLKALDVSNVQEGQVLAASLAAVREYQQQARNEALAALPLTASAPAAASAPAVSAAPAASAPAAASAASAEGRAL